VSQLAVPHNEVAIQRAQLHPSLLHKSKNCFSAQSPAASWPGAAAAATCWQPPVHQSKNVTGGNTLRHAHE